MIYSVLGTTFKFLVRKSGRCVAWRTYGWLRQCWSRCSSYHIALTLSAPWIGAAVWRGLSDEPRHQSVT